MIRRARPLPALRALSIGLAAAALLVGAGACKRRELPKVELLDEDGTHPETEGVAALAPTWPPAERALLGDDLLVHWLTEEGSPAAHLRLLLPTHGQDEISAAAAAVVAEAVALDLRRWIQRYGASVELRAGVDRFEIAVHGQGESLDALIAGLGRVVSQADPAPLLDRARDAVASGVTTLGGDTLALTALVGLLDGRDPGRERFDRDTVMLLDEAALGDAWKALLDPARALLIVHAGRPVSEAAMTRLSKSWPKSSRLSLTRASDQAHERLRPAGRERGKGSAREAPAGARLRGEGAAALHLIETAANDRSGSLLYLGRIIPLADARDRAIARLAQRLLQEELDARLTVVGERGLFAIRLRISRAKATPTDEEGAPPKDAAPAKGRRDDKKEAPRDPRARRLVGDLDGVLERVRARLPRARLAQAAELWLGARVVQASITGEDWTALWSESLDLSLRDAEIAGAIARDAQAMLAITPEELVEWSGKWLDFERGEPGWAWVAASNEADLAGALAEVTRIEPLAR